MLYLLKNDTLEALRQVDPAALSVDQRLSFEARAAYSGGAPRSMTVRGDA